MFDVILKVKCNFILLCFSWFSIMLNIRVTGNMTPRPSCHQLDLMKYEFCSHVEVQTLALGPGLPTGPRSPFAPIKPWRQTQRDVGGQICSTCIQGSKYHRRSVKEIVGCHCAFHGRYTARILPTIGLITHLIETDTGLVSN